MSKEISLTIRLLRGICNGIVEYKFKRPVKDFIQFKKFITIKYLQILGGVLSNILPEGMKKYYLDKVLGLKTISSRIQACEDYIRYFERKMEDDKEITTY